VLAVVVEVKVGALFEGVGVGELESSPPQELRKNVLVTAPPTSKKERKALVILIFIFPPETVSSEE
jgi:hypothetical protein